MSECLSVRTSPLACTTFLPSLLIYSSVYSCLSNCINLSCGQPNYRPNCKNSQSVTVMNCSHLIGLNPFVFVCNFIFQPFSNSKTARRASTRTSGRTGRLTGLERCQDFQASVPTHYRVSCIITGSGVPPVGITGTFRAVEVL